MKKLFFIFSFIFLTLLTPQSISAEQINEFTATIDIQKNGQIKVEEKIVYDFGTFDRHGIYRYIPYVKTNKEGKKFKMDINFFSVTDQFGNPYRYSTSYNSNKFNIKIGDPNKTINGIHSYIITYSVGGALTYFSNHDELYWNITGNDWTVPILSAGVAVNFPEMITEDQITKVCYAGILESSKQCLSTFQDSQWVFRTLSILNPGQGMTVVAGFPIDIVTRLEPKPVISFFDTIFGKIFIFTLGLLALLWYVIYPIWLPIKWLKFGRDPSTSSGQVRAWYDPPKTKSGRSLTPAETGTVIDESVDMPDILATVVDLARRGYYKIVEKKKGDFYLVLHSLGEGGSADTLQPFEKKLFDNIFDSGQTEVRIKDAKLIDTVEETKKIIYKEMIDNGFFPDDPHKTRVFYGVITGLALFTMNIPLVLTSLIFGRAMPKKTIFGKEQADVAKSLFSFLSSQKKQLAFQADKQMFFEKLLPYAVAFGVEKVWAKRFSDFALKQPDWYESYDQRAFNSVVFASILSSSLSSFRASATPITSSSGFSSGSSGGFSGGGGGGGGGGSW